MALRRREIVPSYLASPESTTVRKRQVDPDAEGVGADDDAQQAGLGEPFDESAVLRQHPAVVDPDAVVQQARERAAEARGEAEAHERLGDRFALGPGRHLRRGERLGVGEHLGLGEVDDVERRLVGCEERLDRLVQRRAAVLEAKRHRSRGRAHDRDGAARAAREALLDGARVAERGRHEDELRPGQLESGTCQAQPRSGSP